MLRVQPKRFAIAIFMLLLTFLQGCGEDGTSIIKAQGNSPEYSATMFFHAIYDADKNLNKVGQFATPKLRRIIKSFGSTKAVARNLLNMQFDKVTIEVDKGRNLRETYGTTATITLIFHGRLHGNKVTDLRTVKLVKREGNWLVDKIKDDPYAR